MNIFFPIKAIILTGVLLCPAQLIYADNDSDHEKARRLLNSGEIKSLDDILTIVRKTYPGKLLEVELETENQHFVYEVEILGTDGVVKEIYINAKTGKLISVKNED